MKVQLKDTSGSFFDPATGFSLTRDEVKELDDRGSLTLQFKQAGHIVEVNEKKKGNSQEPKPE